MDLLKGYGSDNSSSSSSSSSSSDEDDVEYSSSTAANAVHTTTTTTTTSSTINNDDSAIKPTTTNIDIVSINDVSPNFFVRSVPHIPGNWAGHVFCPLPLLSLDCGSTTGGWNYEMNASLLRFQKLLQQRQQQQQKTIKGPIVSHIPTTTGGTNNPFAVHLSMSRPFVLQLSSIDSFVAQLQRRLQYLPTTTLRVHHHQEKILVNDEHTRSFWTWPIDSNGMLMAILREINAVLKLYRQPVYYDPPLFHASLASVADDLSSLATTSSNEDDSNGNNGCLYFAVDQIHCTFGTTKHYTIDLSQP